MTRKQVIIPMRNNANSSDIEMNPHRIADGDFFSDISIVGAGVAGLSAGIFAVRRGYTVNIISADCGGQTASTAEIENYPGCGKIEGPDLVASFVREAKEFGCALIGDRISGIVRGDFLLLRGERIQYRCRALIIASGKSPRELSARGEKEFFGQGVYYAGALDADTFRDLRVLVVGGGNSAMDAAVRVARTARHVTLAHRRDRLSGERVLEDRLFGTRNISLQFNTTVTAIEGSTHVEWVRLLTSPGEEQVIPVDAVIIAVGFEMQSSWFREAVSCTTDGRIRIDEGCRTDKEDIFAAGDCTTVPYQQIVISAGEGAKAALSAARYLDGKDGKRSARTDWGYT